MSKCPVCGSRVGECMCEHSVNWLCYKWKSITTSEMVNEILNKAIVGAIVSVILGALIIAVFFGKYI